MKISKSLVIAALLVVLALGGGFFAGMQYQKSQRPAFAGAAGQLRGRFGAGQGNQAFRPVRGQVLSVSDTGMTVKMMDGSSRIVVVSGSTQFMKADSASKSDVKTGDSVMVIGTQNSDGSVTAQNVQINPVRMQVSPSPTAAK